MLEQTAEEAEAPIGGVDDRGARLGGRNIGTRHQSVVSDYSPVVEPDCGPQLARRERRHQVARPVEIRVYVAQLVVLVQELGDWLGVVEACRSDLDRIGQL